MSKYAPLWDYVIKLDCDSTVSFDKIKSVLGFEIDHSFLSFKKELITYGFTVGKISLKNKTVEFKKTK